jgi:sugar phosphate isomerase/epimerase
MFKNLCPAALGVSGRESEIIELTLSWGFKGLDLDLAEFAAEVKQHDFAKASRLLVSARLKVGGFPLPVRWHSDDADYQADLAALEELLVLAEQLGCTRAVTMIEAGSDSRPYHENYEFHRRRLNELGEALAKHSMQLAVGFLAPLVCRKDCAFQFMQKTDEMLMLLGNVAAPNVGLALDTWHWHLGGGSLEQLQSLDKNKIVTVALSDVRPELSAADAKLADRLLPGEGGAIDTVAILRWLAETRYDGPVTPVADESQFEGQSRDLIVKSAAASFDTVWKAAGLNAAGKLAPVGGR